MSLYRRTQSLVYLLVCLHTGCLLAQTDQPASHRVFVTANTADLALDSPFYEELHGLLRQSDAPFTLVLNGDLIKGKHTPLLAAEDTLRMRKLLKVTKGLDGRVIIVPGDRDWAESGRRGLQRIRMLQQFVENPHNDRVTWMIGEGCPGPKSVDLSREVRLLAIQTQWWNHPHDKPTDVDAACEIATQEDFLEKFEGVVEESIGKNILIVGHFPVFSLGEYGGRMPIKKHLFPLTDLKPNLYLPLPVLGSLYCAYRQNVGTKLDIVNKRYERFRKHLEDIIFNHQSLIYLSGHDENMQIIRQGDNYYVNSGSAAQARFVGKDRSALFSEPMRGIMEIAYYADGDIFARIHRYGDERGFELFTERYLFQSVCHINDSIVPINTLSMFCGDGPDGNRDAAPLYDSVVAAIAGHEYEAGKTRRLFFGTHYRDTWTTPVPVSYLNLDTTAGGLTPLKKGGGTQTLALRLMGGDGREYTFRSVDKNPARPINFDLRTTVIGYVLNDQTATQHPYGALVAAPLMDALNILHATPTLYLLPDDPKLGLLRAEYGDLFGMLEENPKAPPEVKSTFGDAQYVEKSLSLFRILYQNPRARIDRQAYARARIFDMYTGDWDRHEDNWKWAGYERRDGLVFEPIPRDRDHIFSRWDGAIPWIVDREWVRPYGEHFGRHIRDVKSLNWKARHIDRFLLSGFTREQWLAEARLVQQAMTDSVIRQAVAALPLQAQAVSANRLIEMLKSRRQKLDQAVLKYYRLLSRAVDVVCTNQDESIDVVRNPNGSVSVSVLHIQDQTRLYERTFLPGETREIRLYGLAGDDLFSVSGTSRRSIRLRIVGGPGNDVIRETSETGSLKRQTLIYEKDPNAKIDKGSEGRIVHTLNHEAYNFQRTSFSYHRYFPYPLINFNLDDGLLMTAGVQFMRRAYGKTNFSSSHLFEGTYSTAGARSLGYYGLFREVIRSWDIELEAGVADPSRYFFFFGLGNETKKSDNQFMDGFYRTRYSSYNLSLGMKVDFWKRSRFGVYARYENNEAQIPDNTILFQENDVLGVDKANIALLRAELDLDLRDNPNFPDKGMRFFFSHDNGFLTTNANSNFGKTLVFLESYSTLRTYLPLTLALLVGAGDSYGEIPFYRQFALGHRDYLRGYRKNRFTGDAMAFVNTEVRLELVKKERNVIPFRFGIKGFFDTGRIIQDGENSKKWHMGYGLGCYFIPFTEEVALNVSLGYSEEERHFFKFSIGKTFR